ncbi:MAG: hypothetical protein OEV76_09480 [Anaerolineae bacterium]|nr:hypothetical protein [Anaerolineae bacterium]
MTELTTTMSRSGQDRVVPTGSAYKIEIRSEAYYFRDAGALPCYLQAGPGFFI